MVENSKKSALMNVYARSPLVMERGEGVYLFDSQNKQYLDFCAGIAVNALGYNHPHLVKTLQEAASLPWHVSNIYTIPLQEKLAQRLCEKSFADKVFFCNSGAEAIEGAIKLARKYHSSHGNPQKYRIITMNSAFHGRTLASLAAGGNQKYLEGFGPAVEGFDQIPFNNLNALRAKIGDETAAILIEPIQGEGGLRVANDQLLKEIKKAADEYGLLVIYDEVQCGNGRSGKYWAYEWSGIAPDILATAKGLGGGFPIGAFMATERVANSLEVGSHGTTFGGNPLAMAVANAVLDILSKDEFLAEIVKVSEHFSQSLAKLIQQYPEIYLEQRGRGLMQGLVLTDAFEARAAVAILRDYGLLCVSAGQNVIRMLPPLIIKNQHIDEACLKLEQLAEHISQIVSKA